MKEWTCLRCEHINGAETTVCEICNNPIASLKEEPAPAPPVKKKSSKAVAPPSLPLPSASSGTAKKKFEIEWEKDKKSAETPPSKPVFTPLPPAAPEEANLNEIVVVLCFLFPIVGLIIGLSLASNSPKKSKSAFVAAAWGIFATIILFLIIGTSY
ncbi:MAG TPA: hypothetical protein PLR06_13585 [Cyclobacteriaceae bacterium]|nr:hypothetical protein [Cyclobacteriaceae bacterium]